MLGLLLSACSLTVIEGSGSVVTEEREVGDFENITLESFGELIITQGDEPSLIIEADDNLMQYITTEVKGDTLHIGFTDDAFSIKGGDNQIIKPSESIVFRLTMPDLNTISLSGASPGAM